MGFASECVLTCDIEEVGGSGVSGTACVQEKEGGGIVFSGDLAGLLPSSSGGFHIHSGRGCADAISQGGHYWANPKTDYSYLDPTDCPISVDPWAFSLSSANWDSDENGYASPVNMKLGEGDTLGGTFNVGDDDTTCGVKGHTVIVHKGGAGAPPGIYATVGCCVLA